MIPIIIPELLGGLGVGQQVIIGATVLLFVLYLFRGKKAAGRAVGVMGKLWLSLSAVGLALGLAIIFNWVDPNPGAFFNDSISFIQSILTWGKEVVGDTVRHFFG